ncbi:DUF7289 family protein [Halomarina litorea]|uniref:DUF7289 family protein n=1 Tax=Halomarina litorea TaxID=2961595 RepID=UPI0020C35CFC|nr:hypothetical protein [Halomarina sp. BCD28]
MTPSDASGDRAQSHVVGVALLLGIAVVSMAGLTASVGTLVQENAAGADAARVADGFDAALEPVEATGVHRGEVAFADGTLRSESRELRVLDRGGVDREVEIGALVFEAGDRRVTYLAGAVLRGTGDGARMVERPPFTASRAADGVLVVGAPRVGDPATVSGREVSLTLRTNVSHERVELGDGEYRLGVETRTPAAWERYFSERGRETTRRDFDDDGVESVVAAYDGTRTAYLVVHDLRTEVEDA